MLMANKYIVITGASDGLGKYLAIYLAKAGATVILLARNEEKLKALTSDISKAGGNACYYICDLNNYQNITKTIKDIKNSCKFISILINNAAVLSTVELENQDPEIVDSTFKTNVIGPMILTKGLLNNIHPQTESYIVNILSDGLLSDDIHQDYTTYITTKGALAEYSRILRIQRKSSGTRVIDFYPGPFASTIFERVGKINTKFKEWMMTPEYVANTIVDILSQPTESIVDKYIIHRKE